MPEVVRDATGKMIKDNADQSSKANKHKWQQQKRHTKKNGRISKGFEMMTTTCTCRRRKLTKTDDKNKRYDDANRFYCMNRNIG